ncbi:terminase large subunit domain-containing protein [Dyadobacter sp. CY323]|uniref:terminase large subunit domain-containing protein n=1 Tax=Dyadobacter sp. CY323 TaxID=2907302 RepID=UPI001F2142FA|nr:terminase family protein [Dyadobacter sp. CY323]MCE6987475.1 terminase family protein [Dyadobacter sp. CY323]
MLQETKQRLDKARMRQLAQKANIVFLATKQRLFLQSTAKRKTMLAGRAFGKTFLMLTCIGYIAKMLPRAKFYLAGRTFKQLLDIVLTDSADTWASMGWYEYHEKVNPFGNYVLFKEPPADWPKAYKSPKSWERCICFDSGFCLQLLSFEKPDSNRGGNYDGGFVDESALFKSEWVTKILMAMLYRANTWRFKDSHLHNSFYDFTSNPWTQAGQWVFNTEELMRQDPAKYLFMEGTAHDNPTLHPDFIKNMEDTTEPLVFQIEVLNKRLAKLPNSYYPSFEAEKHCTSNTFTYDQNADGIWLPIFVDYDPNRPLEVSMDFNNYICSSIVCQEVPGKLKVINTVYVKQSREKKTLAESLAIALDEAYSEQIKKDMIVYGDASASSKSAGSKTTFFSQVVAELRTRGWKVTLRVLKTNPEHRDRFALIDRILAEGSTQLPRVRINQNTCKALMISIQNSPVTSDMKKDKSSEGTSIQQEYATHLSDCFDYILYYKYSSSTSKGKSTGTKMRFLGSR